MSKAQLTCGLTGMGASDIPAADWRFPGITFDIRLKKIA